MSLDHGHGTMTHTVPAAAITSSVTGGSCCRTACNAPHSLMFAHRLPPACRYVRVKGEHHPTQKGIDAGRQRAKLKLKLLGSMLLLLGKQRELQALQMALKSFSVHNSLPYNKSMVCSVENVRALQQQMTPKEQQVWERGGIKAGMRAY